MDIPEKIKKTIRERFAEVPNTDLEYFFKICTYKKLKNKEVFIHAGTLERKLFYIISGVTRGYVINEDDTETNLFLRPEGGLTMAYDQLLEKNPTQCNFEAILESEVLLFDMDEFESLCANNPSLYKIYIWALKNGASLMAKRVVSMIQNTPEQRYENLLKAYPIFFQKAFNKHIANYLGITPVSLSRMIKRIKERKKNTK